MRLSLCDVQARGPHGEDLVNGISFDVAAGETLAILGASGSGKSLTGRAIIALPPAGVSFSGSVSIDGDDLLKQPERQRRRRRGADVAMVFQEPATALNPVKRIGAQIEEPLLLHTAWPQSERRARVAALLERTGLAAAGIGPERYPHELSGGQRQRVALAIAMALSPRVVVADEPTSALDSVAAKRVLDLLEHMTAESSAALVLITHDLAVAARADRIAVMDAGRIAECAPSSSFLKAPQTEAGRRLTGVPAHVPPTVPGDLLVEVDGLCVERGSATLLHDASLKVRRGERVALVGASGSGKTTLARALVGLLPAQGHVRISGREASFKERRRCVQLVFQDPATSFNPRHSVGWSIGEQLHRSSLSRAERSARIHQSLDAVGLDPAMARRKPHAFSGGQRQRLAIARALVNRPDALIADEAVSALDAALRNQIVTLLATLSAAHGMALLFIAHDLALVAKLAHRVIVMDRGTIVEEGSPAALFRAPQHPATRALVEAAQPPAAHDTPRG